MPLSSLYRLSVRTQLLWLLCAAMLPLLGLLFRQIYLERLEARERANDKVRILAQQTAQSLNQVLRDYEAVLQRIVQRPLVRALDARACDPLIAEFVRLYPGFTNLVVQDLKGGNDCSFLDSKITPEQLALVPGYVQARTAEGMTVGGSRWGLCRADGGWSCFIRCAMCGVRWRDSCKCRSIWRFWANACWPPCPAMPWWWCLTRRDACCCVPRMQAFGWACLCPVP